ncbi:MAG: SDR family oxidoreductase [Candidatus Eisenbacteria sp.]|nr:SDR family oxidoreductase [Candidatus Eisenbacteria bacterium]
MAAKYLVSGGAGFIGSHLAEHLLGEGEAVRVLDDFSTGSRDTVASLQAKYGAALEVIEGDVADEEACRRAVVGVAFVFHQAALASVPRSLEDPLATNRANVAGTLCLLQAAREARVHRFIYAASSSVYGDAPTLPKVETMRPAPLSPYALTKYVGEEYARLFAEHFGLETVALRYFNVFGPRQDPDSAYSAVIPLFVKRLLRGEPPVIHGDGEQSRDFTYIANVVDANLAACHTPGASGAYNIACGEQISLLAILARLQEILGTKISPCHEDPRPGDVKHSRADISRAQAELGYRPKVSLDDGLATTVEYFRRRFSDG